MQPAQGAPEADSTDQVGVAHSSPTPWPSASRLAVTGAEAVNRSYNFFDDLDATLARLQHPASGTIEN